MKRYSGYGYGFNKMSVTVSLDQKVYDLLRRRSDELLITPAQYINTALLNQLHKDYANDLEFAKKIGVKNLLQ